MASMAPIQPILEQARRAQEAGRPAEAVAILQRAVASGAAHPVLLNMLGVGLIGLERAGEAIPPLERAVASDPASPHLLLNLGTAQRQAGKAAEALASFGRALERDPYLVAAMINRAELLEQLGDKEAALAAYRILLQATANPLLVRPEHAPAIAYGRDLVTRHGRDRRRQLESTPGLSDLAQSNRAQAYLDQLCGLRTIYAPQPSGAHFPFLPAMEYFDEADFPWFAELEAATDIIRQELLTLWHEDAPGFEPYVRYRPDQPVNQWKELNHSPRWNAFFLWKDGVRQDENVARCPNTAALLERLPMTDIPGKAPTAMFSILAPNTTIPPHTGATNTRAIVHLPLVVPDHCGFRVGGETREWVEGRALAFDDTIEHEAWNRSDRPRAVLILDCWNPFLSEDERELVRRSSR